MVGMVILGETEAQRDRETCLDSSSAQVTRPGFELKSADSETCQENQGPIWRRAKKTVSLEVFRVSWKTRQTGMNLFITLYAKVMEVWSSFWDSLEAGRGLGLGQNLWVQGGEKAEEGDKAWLEAASTAETRGDGVWTCMGGRAEDRSGSWNLWDVMRRGSGASHLEQGEGGTEQWGREDLPAYLDENQTLVAHRCGLGSGLPHSSCLISGGLPVLSEPLSGGAHTYLLRSPGKD